MPLKTFCTILLSSLVALIVVVPTPLEAAPRLGQSAPSFHITTTSGQSVTLENYRGSVLVVDFFATWCQPCRQSIPHLIEMKQKYGKQGFQVLGLSADEEGERRVMAFADEFHINYPLAVAGDTVTTDFGVRSVPVMFVIDKKGILADVYRGYSDEKGRGLEGVIKRLLAEK